MNTNKSNSIKNKLDGKATETNKEGASAYDMSDKAKLVNLASTWLVNEPKFYGGKDGASMDSDIIAHIRTVAENDYEFVLKLASYLRNKQGLRTAPQVLLAEASMSNIGMPKVCVRDYASDIIRRPDEMASVIAYTQSVLGDIGDQRKGGSLPTSLKRALANVFLKFDEYQLQKWNNKSKQVKLLDVLRLVHPKPKNDAQAKLLQRLRDDELAIPNTWSTIVTEKGNPDQWNKALENMPYQATLMNLRNIMQSGADIDKAMKLITNPEAIKKSKMFPFQFTVAYDAVNDIEDYSGDKQFILDGLADALEIAAENLSKLPGNTLILADNSGSMSATISSKGQTRAFEIADIMLCIAHKMCEKSTTWMFATDVEPITISTRDSIMTNYQKLRDENNGGGTYAHKAFDKIVRENIKFDRIIMLSDMQCYTDGWAGNVDESFEEYKRKVNQNAKLYSVNLCGYGTLQVPENDNSVCLIDGWSDKILEYIPKFEEGTGTMLEDIENTKPSTL